MRKHRQNWLDIFSGFRVALDARKIILGTLGAYATIFVVLGLLAAAGHWWPGAHRDHGRPAGGPFTTVCSMLRSLPEHCCANLSAL